MCDVAESCICDQSDIPPVFEYTLCALVGRMEEVTHLPRITKPTPALSVPLSSVLSSFSADLYPPSFISHFLYPPLTLCSPHIQQTLPALFLSRIFWHSCTRCLWPSFPLLLGSATSPQTTAFLYALGMVVHMTRLTYISSSLGISQATFIHPSIITFVRFHMANHASLSLLADSVHRDAIRNAYNCTRCPSLPLATSSTLALQFTKALWEDLIFSLIFREKRKRLRSECG